MRRLIRRNNFRGLATVECPACGRFAADRALVTAAVAGERDLACPRGHVVSWRKGLVQSLPRIADLAKSSVASWTETIDSIVRSLAAHEASVAALRRRLAKARG